MANDDGYGDRHERGYGREGRETRWSGDENAFGGGWGNQRPNRARLGGRNSRGEPDRNDEDRGERYGSGVQEGYGASSDQYSSGFAHGEPRGYGGPGYDSEFAGPRFDRADAGSTGTHGVHPVGSASGSSYRGGSGQGGSGRRWALAHRDEDRGGSDHDPHYSEWRQRQIDRLDRDYDEFRREHHSRFEEEFGAWRERRNLQRKAMDDVSEHMEVIGSDGKHIGTVDKVRDERIILTKSDPNADGMHHSVPCSWIETVDDKVRVNRTADEAMEEWRNEDRSRALFENEGTGSEGPHMLNRSFSGTYDRR